MKVPDVALICSGSPGFLRSLGSLLAGRCRLMECYSIPDAAQMIQLHSPDFSIFDVRSCSPQQLARTFAAISNIKSGQAALICVPDQLAADRIPQEIAPFCSIIELSNHDENYYDLVEEILLPLTAKAASRIDRNSTASNRSSLTTGTRTRRPSCRAARACTSPARRRKAWTSPTRRPRRCKV